MPRAGRGLAAAILVLLVPAGVLATWAGASSGPGFRSSGPGSQPVAPAPPPDVPTLACSRVARGQTLATVLERLGLSATERAEAVEALHPMIDPRRLQPGTGVCRAGDGSGAWLTIRAEPGFFVRLRPRLEPGPPWSAQRVEIPVEVRPATWTTTLEETVYRAFASHPHGLRLAAAFTEIVQWDVDLMADPRPGDRLAVVYESRRLGTLPADTPPFRAEPAHSGAPLEPGRILAAEYLGARRVVRAFWVPDDGHGGGYYDERGRSLRKAFLRSPLRYTRISSGFSRRRLNPVTRTYRPHHGVDFAAPAGTPVLAAADGTVVHAGWAGALGRAVKIRHAGRYTSVYGHLRSIARGIRPGLRVRQGDRVGTVGATGRATGPHLHYALLDSGRAVNPLRFRNPPVQPLQPEHMPHLEARTALYGPALDALLAPSVSLLRESPDPLPESAAI